ncbi:MAG: hypothetical protein CML06_17345 [Pseudomonadales bacterium]|nr:hypothetical protein [Pseudomonadales bacterium]
MLLLIDLPQPVHGMSTVNRAFLEHIRERGVEARVINTVPSYAARYFGSFWWFPVKIIHTIGCLLRLLGYLLVHPRSRVYRSVNGGIGQAFDIFYLAFCRLLGARLYIHHHSYSYINRPSRLFAFINRIAGPRTVHIVLGEDMKLKLSQLYAIPLNRIRVQSNLAFFTMGDRQPETDTKDAIIIGHLANLTFDKGLDTFVEVCYRLAEMKVRFRAYIAGPTQDAQVKALVEQVTQDLPESVHYIGPLYGEQKDDFYQQLDVFVFPTKYVNEAEPLVLYEAATHGAMLVGTRRGCMQQVIDSLGGHSFQEDESLAASIAGLLQQAQQQQAFAQHQRLARSDRFARVQRAAKQSLNSLVSEFKSSHVSRS